MLVVAGLMALASSSGAQTPKPATKPASTAAAPAVVDATPWTGDFDGMFTRGRIRMLVPYSRSLFYVEEGKSHGLTADLARDFETYLNNKHAKALAGRKITVTVIPTTRDRLLSDLVDGKGDISGGNLTATGSRMRIVDFVAPTETAPAQELLVSGPNAAAVATVDDLSGKRVNVRQASSYLESLEALNERFSGASKPSMRLVTMPDALEDEDVLEMLNAGLFDYTVVDSWKANLWAETLPRIKVHENIALRTGGTIGWAIRKQSPKLQAELDGFYKTASQQGLIAARLTRHRERLREIKNSSDTTASHFDQKLALLKQYGKQYPFDPLMLVAEGFRESHRDAGAGLAAAGTPTPPTSAAEVDANVQAATKYIDQIMATSFADAKFSELDRSLFTFASYKVSPEKIAGLRQEAAKRGLDPNQWFNNVEQVSAEKLGLETTAYIRNVLKYGVASKIAMEAPATQK
jgi:membrane-bound lytic murein transglycosylase MltF